MHIDWLEQTESDVPEDDDWLSEGEGDRQRALRFPKRRADWRLGRWTAKLALAARLHISRNPENLAGIEIRAAPCGAPEAFLDGRAARATISISHCDGFALCAVAQPGAALGCDIERIEPRSAAFASDYFTEEEQGLVAHAAAGDPARLLTLLWSAKESALKALRTGLRLDTRSVSIMLGEGGEIRAHCFNGQVFHGWWEETRGGLLRTFLAAPRPDRLSYAANFRSRSILARSRSASSWHPIQ
jgi:4'-phosphopantetheinyl transferase